MRALCGFSLLILATCTFADEWQMLEESEFLFEASWEGTPLPGQFKEFEVSVAIDASDVTSSALTVSVDLAAADMDDPDINEAIAGPEWFAIADYPHATYKSKSISSDGPGNYVAEGELELKGIRKSVVVPFTWSESEDRAEMTGELTIDRTRFEVGSGEWADDESIGIDVRLFFRVKLARLR